MPKEYYDIKPVGVKYICDSCEEGELEYTGIISDHSIPLFKHKCSECGEIRSFELKYPTIEWTNVN
ncbi:hypothetical protein [Priestia flexa]|uniref:hypothetical protein n=1 Tax=Priestia flexa TaxID=86664 RepID=UPI0004742C65|nr:hypothetical protein [Priestia flexa]